MAQVKNYAKELERLIEGLEGRRPSLLLHCCCAPCSSAVLEYLNPHFQLYLLYYNPNIAPEAEYQKRLACLFYTYDAAGDRTRAVT